MLSSLPQGESQPIIAPIPRGTVLHTAHTERTVKVFGVLESELQHISLLNGLSVACSSIGSFFLALSVSIVVNWLTQGELTSSGKSFLQIVAPTCAFIALLCYGGALWSHNARQSQWKEIDRASQPTIQPISHKGDS